MATEYSPSKAMTEEAQELFERETICVKLSPNASRLIRQALIAQMENGVDGDEFNATLYMFNRIVSEHCDEEV